MPSFTAAKAYNSEYDPNYLPVAVFVGATAGIGKSMAQSFAHILNGRARIIIVGRNETAAQEIIKSLPDVSGNSAEQGGGYEFIQCDITVMKNIHELTKTLRERLPKINYLVISAGVISLKGWEETEDGLDKKLVSRYYSRWALTNDLLPLLRSVKDAGEDAKVVSILGAGKYAGIDLDDLGLKKSFSGLKAMMQSISYNDLMMAEFAERDPDISFIHIFPGNVDTGSLKIDHWLALPFKPLILLIAWLFSVKPEVCAEHMLYALLASGKGLSRRNDKGDDIGDANFPQVEGAQKKLWEHSVEVTKSTVM